MKQLVFWVWALVVLILSWFVASGRPDFDYFWQAWEFLAALTALIYNLFFAVIVYESRDQEGEGLLHRALEDGHGRLFYHWLRIGMPTACLAGTVYFVLDDRHNGGAPVPEHGVFLKLVLTLLAFAFIMAGDLVTRHQLRDIADAHRRPLSGWIDYFTTHIWLIDAPFVLGYVGLLSFYSIGRYDSIGAPRPSGYVLLLQAFVGGASALEMMVQSAIHGFSEIGDRHAS